MDDKTDQTAEYEGWALLEIMGHRQTAGRISEVQIGGATMLRVDVPKPGHGGANNGGASLALNGGEPAGLALDEIAVTQYYGGSSIYCMTPCDEETARKALNRRWGLPRAVQLALPAVESAGTDDDDLDDEKPF